MFINALTHFIAGPPRPGDHVHLNNKDSNVTASADLSSIHKGINHSISIKKGCEHVYLND